MTVSLKIPCFDNDNEQEGEIHKLEYYSIFIQAVHGVSSNYFAV